jgi:AcrR family transcriptional regulator
MDRKAATVRHLRADARRNLESLHAAALEAFRERGLNTPLEDIANRAGVSVGTLYNRFGSRGALIDAVVSGMASEQLDAVVAQAKRQRSAWQRFASFTEGICALQAANPALNDMVTKRFPEATQLTAVCDAALEYGRELITEAHRERGLRRGFTERDLYSVFWANASLVELGSKSGDQTAWRRHLKHLLAGLRAPASPVT